MHYTWHTNSKGIVFPDKADYRKSGLLLLNWWLFEAYERYLYLELSFDKESNAFVFDGGLFSYRMEHSSIEGNVSFTPTESGKFKMNIHGQLKFLAPITFRASFIQYVDWPSGIWTLNQYNLSMSWFLNGEELERKTWGESFYNEKINPDIRIPVTVKCPECFGWGQYQLRATPGGGPGRYADDAKFALTKACGTCGGKGIQYEEWYREEKFENGDELTAEPFQTGKGSIELERYRHKRLLFTN